MTAKKQTALNGHLQGIHFALGEYPMKQLVLIALAAGCLPVTASAQDFDWTGFYLGIASGHGWSQVAYTDGWAIGAGSSPAGVTVAASVGAMTEIAPSLTVGLELSYSPSTLEKVHYPIGATAYWRVSNQSSAIATVGYSFGQLLPFVGAGWTFAELSAIAVYDPPIVPDQHGYGARSGPTMVMGSRYALTEHISVSGEVRYTDFGSAPLNFDNGGAPNIRVTLQEFRAGAQLSF